MKKVRFVFLLLFACTITYVHAQHSDKFEFTVEAGAAKAVKDVFSYNFEFSPGYKFNDHITLGAGVGFVNYDNRTDLPTVYKDKLVRFETGWHNSWRIYLHGKYELSPIRRITPFVRVNIGYAFFSHKNERPYWDQEGNPIVVPFDVKGGISPSLDLGYSKRIGDSNIKLSGAFFILYQPISYNYASYNVKKDLFSLGAKIGVVF